MIRTALVSPVLVLPLLLTACGGDEPTAAPTTPTSQSSTPAPEPVVGEPTSEPTSEPATATAPAGDLPSYDEVKALYLELADDATLASCADGGADVEVPAAPGETYTRFTCGDIERFDYVLGAETYADNYPSMTEPTAYKAVFHVPGQLVVDPSGSDEDLAPAIRSACGCGEVVDVVLE